MGRFLRAPAGKRWRWRVEPLVFLGYALIVGAICDKWFPSASLAIPFAIAVAATVGLGWRLEPIPPRRCVICGVPVDDSISCPICVVFFCARHEWWICPICPSAGSRRHE